MELVYICVLETQSWEFDSPLADKKLSTEKLDFSKSKVYTIYMAYKCDKCKKETSTIYANKKVHMMLCWECDEEICSSETE